MNMFKRLRAPKRMFGLMGLGTLALVLAACSPGTVTTPRTIYGSDQSAKDFIRVSMTCTTALNNNCRGIVVGKIAGLPFIATSGHGGFGDQNNLGPDPYTGTEYVVPRDCTGSPCSTYAAGEISGNAVYGVLRPAYTLDAYDNYPATSSPDEVTIDINGFTTNFYCAADCVTIHMQPGHVPNTYNS